MEKNVYSRNPALVAPGEPLYPLGEPTKPQAGGTPIVATQPAQPAIGNNNSNPPINVLAFETPQEFPPIPVRGSVGNVANNVNNNAPVNVLMNGDVKTPTPTTPVKGSPITEPTPAPTTKPVAETEKETYKKWFVITVVVLGIIILIRVFK